MEVNKDLLCHVGPIVGLSNTDIVICCVWIEFIKKNKKTKRVLLATEYALSVFEKGYNGKSFSISHQFKWTDLKEVQLPRKDIFVMNYQEGRVKISHNGATYLLKLMITHVSNILLPHEMPKLNLPPEIISDLPHLNDAFVRRFRFQLKCSNQKIPDDLMKALSKVSNNTELDISKLPASVISYIDVLLSCLQVEPNICSLVLPKSKNTYWNQLANCLQYNTTLKTLVTSERLDSNTKRLCESLQKNKNSKLSEFAFIESDISAKQLSFLSFILTSAAATSLYFERSMTAEIMGRFITTTAYASTFRNIQSLTVKEITGLYIKDIFDNLKNLKSIVFIDCNLNVVEVLQEISRVTYASICVIGGHSSGKFNPNIKLNPNLTSLSLSKIKWDSSDTFIAAWNVFMTNQNDGFKLILNDISMPDWRKALDGIGGSGSPKLESFAWEKNQLDSSMLPFFTRSPNLKNLSLLGSLNSTNIIETSKILAKMQKLRFLVVDGSDSQKLCASSVVFLKEFASSKSIEKLSIRNQDFSDGGLVEMTNFLMKNLKIKDIAFDGNKISKPESFLKFFETVMNRGPPLKFHWPHDEMRVFRKNKLLKTADLNHIKECYDIILNGNESIVVTDETPDLSINENEIEPSDNESMKDNDDSGPFSAAVNNSTDVFQNVEWQIDLPPIEPPNGDEIVEDILQKYTLSALFTRMKNI